MSKYEGMNGEGLFMKKDALLLKKRLIDAHNREILPFTPKALKQADVKKANSRTHDFPILDSYDGECIVIGSIAIDTNQGTMRFSIAENNHQVEQAEKCRTFQELMNFLLNLPTTGKKYGGKTYYWGEFDEDPFGNKTSGLTTYYGSWESPVAVIW